MADNDLIHLSQQSHKHLNDQVQLTTVDIPSYPDYEIKLTEGDVLSLMDMSALEERY